MKLFLLASCLCLALGSPIPDAEPKAYASDYTYYLPGEYTYQTPVEVASPVASPVASLQYHAQDEAGQYNYGFQSADQTKSEVKTADGVVRGAYSYVDANGIVQSVNYISDALGFRVAATNLPVHEVGAAAAVPAVETAEYTAAVDPTPASPTPVPVAAAVHNSPAAAPAVITAQVPYTYLPYAVNYGYNYAVPQAVHTVPVAAAQQTVVAAPVVQAAPVVHAAPVVQAAQYHSQDELGQYSFGYNDLSSERHETKTADGVVRGAYRYVDTEGKLQTVEYLADALGFRVSGTNIPVHDVSEPVVGPAPQSVALPVPVQDTPEVAAAKQQHALLYSAALTAAEEAAAATAEEPAVVPYGALEQAADVSETAAYTAEPVAVAAAQAAVVAAAPAPAVTVAQPAVVAAAPVPAVTGSQYHAQDEIGQYTYGYSDGNSVKQEVKSADGIVRGSYSYVDSNGIVQTVNYISDALGFRVGATNLPVHVVAPEAVAPAEHRVDEAPAPVAAAPVAVHAPTTYTQAVIAPNVAYSYLPYASNYAYNFVPVQNQVAVAATHTTAAEEQTAPVVAVSTAPVDTGVVSSQYHAQDELGQYNYGFNSATQTKSEVKTADGVTRGSYSYLDANGIVQTVNYLSDAMGFRVAATNLPVHEVGDVASAVAVEEAKVKAAVEVPEPVHNTVITPHVANYAYLPYAQGYSYNQLVGAY